MLEGLGETLLPAQVSQQTYQASAGQTVMDSVHVGLPNFLALSVLSVLGSVELHCEWLYSWWKVAVLRNPSMSVHGVSLW